LSNVITANTISTAGSRAREDFTNTVATNDVSCRISEVFSWNESSRSKVWWGKNFGFWKFLEEISRIRVSSRRTPPSPGTISRKRSFITNITVGSGETSRAGLGGNQTSLSNITTDFGRITIVDQKLKTVGVFRDETEIIKIPSDFSSKGFRVRDGSNSGRINKSKRRNMGTSTKVPLIVSKIIGRRISTRFRSNTELRDTSAINGGDGLYGRFPQTTD